MIVVHRCTECGTGFTDHPRRGMCHMCYERKRLAGQIPGLVPAAVAREHIKRLVGLGWRYREIARAAGIDRSLIAFIVGGRQRINADTAAAICAVHPANHDRYVRKAWDTRRGVSAGGHEACVVCGRTDTSWRRRGMCEACYEQRRNHGGMEWITSPLAPQGEWVTRAVCAQVDPDLWFPEKGGATREAKKVCMSCPVRDECLEYALANEERFGIWGGKSERERRRLLRPELEEAS
jgi:WhiB family redox-sensing transcriptional regulator